MVFEAITLAAESSAFGFFAVIDGSRVIDDGGRTQLELFAVNDVGRTLINDSASEELHEVYRGIRSFLRVER